MTPTPDIWSGAETLDPQKLLDQQLAEAARQVGYARGASPFYRSMLDGVPGSFADLAAFGDAVPAVTKDRLIAAQREHPPYGGLLAAPPRSVERLYVYPVGQVLAWTHADQARQAEMYAAGMFATGIRDTDLVDITFQYGWVVAGTIWDAGARRLGAAVIPGGAGESSRHATNLRLLGGTCLIGFSTFLERIAHSAREEGIDPATDLDVQKMIIVGEQHGDQTKRTLARTYGGATVREAYGTGETGLVAAECAADPDAMHVHPDVLPEVRDETTGALVADGEGGELYLTPLHVEGMPVLRFRTGDITASVRHEPCACGRTTPRIGRIVGRVGHLLRTKGVFLGAPTVRSVLDASDASLGEFQVVVDRPTGQDRLVLRVESPVPAPERLTQQIVARMKQRAAVSVEVEVVTPGTLAGQQSWFVDKRH